MRAVFLQVPDKLIKPVDLSVNQQTSPTVAPLLTEIFLVISTPFIRSFILVKNLIPTSENVHLQGVDTSVTEFVDSCFCSFGVCVKDFYSSHTIRECCGHLAIYF